MTIGTKKFSSLVGSIKRNKPRERIIRPANNFKTLP
jgi:hypothetical protein